MPSLIEKILQGDELALSQFYQTNAPKILRYLQKRLSEEEAKEVLNDVFLEAIDALPLLRKHEVVLSWLYKIAHHKTVDFYRKKKVTSLVLSKLPFLEPIASEIHEPEFQLEKDRIRDNIENTIHKLSKKYRKILRLHYEDNLSIKDIAVEFNLSPKATESLLYRARQSFKKTYERE